MKQSLLVEVRNLSISYQNRRSRVHRAVEDVSFGLRAGETLGILGESGSGKSTLVLALAGLLGANARLEKGSIEFSGRNVFALSETELHRIRGRQIAIMYQEPGAALNPFLKAGDQVADVLRAHAGLRGQQVAQRRGRRDPACGTRGCKAVLPILSA